MRVIKKKSSQKKFDGQIGLKIEKSVSNKVQILSANPHNFDVHEMIRKATRRIVARVESKIGKKQA